MIKVAILGDIGSGKTFVANKFGYPVFNADTEVANIYKKNKNCFLRLKKKFPKFINTYPIDKNQLKNLILKNPNNIKKISKIVHPLVRVEMKRFLRRNAKKKMVILDIPLYIENKLNKKKDILIFVDAKKKEIEKRLKKRKGYNKRILESLKNTQMLASKKKKKANYIIKNTFNFRTLNKDIKNIKNKILIKWKR